MSLNETITCSRSAAISWTRRVYVSKRFTQPRLLIRGRRGSIAGHGSTLYIGIAMVFVFTFENSVLTFNFKTQFYGTTHVKNKLYAKYFPILPIFFFFLLNSRNSITVLPMDMKLDVCTDDYSESSTNFYLNHFIPRVLILISPTHTLLYKLRCLNYGHTREGQTYFTIFAFHY